MTIKLYGRHERAWGSTSPFTTVRVLAKEKNVGFIVAGDGDRLYGTIDLAASLGIGHRAFFTRFLRGADVDNTYRMNA